MGISREVEVGDLIYLNILSDWKNFALVVDGFLLFSTDLKIGEKFYGSDFTNVYKASPFNDVEVMIFIGTSENSTVNRPVGVLFKGL